MTSTLTDLADAIVTALNAGSWSQPFTAERVALPQFALPTLGTLTVPVVVRSSELKRLTRMHAITVVGIDVGVLKKIGGTGTIPASAIQPYIELVDEFARYFFDASLAGFENALTTVTRPNPVYDQKRLDEKRTFVSVLSLEYRVYG